MGFKLPSLNFKNRRRDYFRHYYIKNREKLLKRAKETQIRKFPIRKRRFDMATYKEKIEVDLDVKDGNIILSFE